MQTDVSGANTQVRKPLVSIFILFALLTIALWLIPASDTKYQVVGAVRPVISYFGFWQSNNYFAPDVPRENIDLRATVLCSDGKISEYQFPRLELMSVPERMIKTAYRKYACDYFQRDFYSIIRPDFAKFLARKFAKSQCTPLMVSVDLYSAPVAEPALGLGKPFAPHVKQRRLIEYTVKPADLE